MSNSTITCQQTPEGYLVYERADSYPQYQYLIPIILSRMLEEGKHIEYGPAIGFYINFLSLEETSSLINLYTALGGLKEFAKDNPATVVAEFFGWYDYDDLAFFYRCVASNYLFLYPTGFDSDAITKIRHSQNQLPHLELNVLRINYITIFCNLLPLNLAEMLAEYPDFIEFFNRHITTQLRAEIDYFYELIEDSSFVANSDLAKKIPEIYRVKKLILNYLSVLNYCLIFIKNQELDKQLERPNSLDAWQSRLNTFRELKQFS